MASGTMACPLAIRTGNVTYIAGKCDSFTVMEVFRSGSVCFFKIANGSFTAAQNETFAILPEGFRPVSEVDYLDSYNKIRIHISSTGDMWSNSTLSNTILRGSISYITA